MKRLTKFVFTSIISVAPIWAHLPGADPRLTGAPGDSTCIGCHGGGTPLNGGPGSVSIATTSTYTPGVKQRITVTVADSAQRRFGFELTARLSSNLINGQAGTLTAVDNAVQIICDNGSRAPCTPATMVQFATHTQTGTTGNSFKIDWTPPATNVGNIVLYAAGNAANGNNATSGDRIYTTSLTLTLAAAVAAPSISSTGGVVNGASFQEGIMQNSWITISGTNFASNSRTWTSAELAGGRLPTSLDGTGVTVNGKSAYIYYISPTQINALSPADDSQGPVEVKVTTNGLSSGAVTAQLNAVSPAFFTFDGAYLAATHADNGLLGKAGLFASAPTLTSPAKPGETIILYGTGFGATNPGINAGQLTDRLAPLSVQPVITIGGVEAVVAFAGLVPPYAGLYQFNVVVPDSLANGDQKVVARVGGTTSLTSGRCCSITVQK